MAIKWFFFICQREWRNVQFPIYYQCLIWMNFSCNWNSVPLSHRHFMARNQHDSTDGTSERVACASTVQLFHPWMWIIRTGRRQSINKWKERQSRTRERASKRKSRGAQRFVCRSNAIVVQPVVSSFFFVIVIIVAWDFIIICTMAFSIYVLCALLEHRRRYNVQ